MLGETEENLISVNDPNSEFARLMISIIQTIVLVEFIYVYLIYCVNLLLSQNMKFMKSIRLYNLAFIIFYLYLTSFEPWYAIWLIPTFMWQKPKNVKNILYITLSFEFAMTTYMFLRETYKLDWLFLIVTISVFALYKIFEKCNKEIKNGITKKS